MIDKSDEHYQVNKQGIEIEFQMLDLNNGKDKSKAGFDLGSLQRIHNGFHEDDRKVEISSSALVTMGEMEAHLSAAIAPGIEVMMKNCYPITMGCNPFFKDYASGHIHSSTRKMDENTWLDLRRKLQSAQPLIALLSQNSPIVGNNRAADVRLQLSHWSGYCNNQQQTMTHYDALAYGRNGQTIECRIPSSAPLFQILAVQAFLRVVIQDESEPIPLPEIHRNWDNVIGYGSSAICYIAKPIGLKYDGFKNKEIPVKATDLFKVYWEENKDIFMKELSTLTASMRSNVIAFYDFISAGHTLSDCYFDVMYDLLKSDKEHKIAPLLSDISLRSYKGENVMKMLPDNPEPFMPLIDKYFAIKDLQDLCDKLKDNTIVNKIPSFDTNVFEAFFNPSNGILNNQVTRDVLYTLSTQKRCNLRDFRITNNIVNLLLQHRIAKMAERDIIVPDQNFGIAVSCGKESGVL